MTSFDWFVIYGGDDYTIIQQNAVRPFNNGNNMNAVLLAALAKNVSAVESGRITTTTATRRACIADDGSTCNNNGYCLTGQCHCTAAGASGSLCALETASASSSDSTDLALGIALGVSLPVIMCLLLLVFVGVLIFIRRRGRREQNSWEIDMAELEMGSQLGAGGFGEVYRAMWKGTDVAVKVVSAQSAGKAAWDNFKQVRSVVLLAPTCMLLTDMCQLQEVSVMTALRHPNVVLFMAACTKPPTMCIVMELMELGSLYDVRCTRPLFLGGDWRRSDICCVAVAAQ